MRVLVVGAGVAGLTLAARLCQQGKQPVIIERAASGGMGYAIGLYPLGSTVLHGLGTYERLAERALPLARYVVASGSGQELRGFDASALTGGMGPILMVSRVDLIQVLESSCGDAELRRGVTMKSLDQHSDGVHVTFDDGPAEWFDVVVACDGAQSTTRESIFGPAIGYDSGWVIWTWWADSAPFDARVAREWWGTGSFFGVYPVPGRVMCVAGAPRSAIDGEDIRSLLRHQLLDLMEHVPIVGDSVDALDEPYRWSMADVRSSAWVDQRVVLCGDSAASVMPTAGVGASNAMRAAAGLADELSRADAHSAPLALTLFEKRCRSMVERNQTESRRLARLMLVSAPPLARLRDEVLRRIPESRAGGTIVQSMRRPF